ncbi:DnaJ-domain-containing protein [Corynespora cassiicola Philippines]|uniref:DnaJ-domain-containing protein n=1 Tax=Corynespora cassiicola Philippines TaxID=1448308 RepID=A0A2T2NKA6_CORCC|nr:DnaJ-domain-containing protein [Corynespora cassiicola Philippines]
MSDSRDLEELAKTATEDFYELLGVAFDAEENDIKRAYRKASIKYHPDKNPDDKAAADKFILLGFARDILIDAKLKGEYDRQRTRRREKALQDELMDGKRRKMKEDLERREREAMEMRGNLKRKRAEEMSEAQRREQEIQRLAEDGKRRRMEMQQKREQQRREEEEEIKRREAETEAQSKPIAPGQTPDMDRTVRVQFQRTVETDSWDKAKVQSMFEKYGKIDSIIMGKDKRLPKVAGEKHRKMVAVAFLVYTRLHHAHAAVSDAKTDYPAIESVSWAGKEPDLKTSTNSESNNTAPSTPVSTPNKNKFRASFTGGLGKGTPSTPVFSFSPKTPSMEEVTMMKLKQAEKKRLEEQIRRQEAAEEAEEQATKA